MHVCIYNVPRTKAEMELEDEEVVAQMRTIPVEVEDITKKARVLLILLILILSCLLLLFLLVTSIIIIIHTIITIFIPSSPFVSRGGERDSKVFTDYHHSKLHVSKWCDYD